MPTTKTERVEEFQQATRREVTREHDMDEIPPPGPIVTGENRVQRTFETPRWEAPLIAMGAEDAAYLVIYRALESAGSDGARRRIISYFYDKLQSED